MQEKIKEICYDLETGCIDWVEASKQLLALTDVSQQRELLVDFIAKMEEKAKEYKYLVPSENFIDEYLRNNPNKTK